MKKLLKKKVNVFGKGIPVFAIVILGLALVSAALVPYLSGMVTGTVNVESPLELTVGSEEVTWSVDAENAFNEIRQDFVLKNNAGTDVSAIVETNITSGLPFSEDDDFGEEFEYFDIGLKISGVNDNAECIAATADYYEDEYCFWHAHYDRHFTGVINGVYYVQMGDGAAIPASETMEGRMKLKFKINVAPAEYTFKTQALTVDKATNLA